MHRWRAAVGMGSSRTQGSPNSAWTMRARCESLGRTTLEIDLQIQSRSEPKAAQTPRQSSRAERTRKKTTFEMDMRIQSHLAFKFELDDHPLFALKQSLHFPPPLFERGSGSLNARENAGPRRRLSDRKHTSHPLMHVAAPSERHLCHRRRPVDDSSPVVTTAAIRKAAPAPPSAATTLLSASVQNLIHVLPRVPSMLPTPSGSVTAGKKMNEVDQYARAGSPGLHGRTGSMTLQGGTQFLRRSPTVIACSKTRPCRFRKKTMLILTTSKMHSALSSVPCRGACECEID